MPRNAWNILFMFFEAGPLKYNEKLDSISHKKKGIKEKKKHSVTEIHSFMYWQPEITKINQKAI